MIRWRGRVPTREQQVANACDDFVNLTPASEIPAEITRNNWAAWLPGQEVPLIGVDHWYGYREEDEC